MEEEYIFMAGLGCGMFVMWLYRLMEIEYMELKGYRKKGEKR